MKKVILFLSLFALLLSCAKDEGVGIENQPQPEEFTYKVSVDQALKSLDIALANIDGETRSAKRSVKSIERVKASQVMDLTRSADIPQLEDLLYVVSFGEGQGSAVLGADKRVEPIFAILDNTSMHYFLHLREQPFIAISAGVVIMMGITLRNILTYAIQEMKP